MSTRQRAARRLSRGGAALTRRTAQWAATNRLAAAGAAIIGTPAALNLWHTQRWTAPAAAAAITWAAWRAGHSPHRAPTDTPTAPTSDGSGHDRDTTPVGEGMLSTIRTDRGTARTYAHPTQSNRTLIRWDKP